MLPQLTFTGTRYGGRSGGGVLAAAMERHLPSPGRPAVEKLGPAEDRRLEAHSRKPRGEVRQPVPMRVVLDDRDDRHHGRDDDEEKDHGSEFHA